MKTRVQGASRSLVGGSLWSLLLLLPAMASADWLVLQTGERIETKGAWTVKGKQVVYTTPEKLLRSLRLSEVNLEASTQASAPARGSTTPARSTAARKCTLSCR